MRIWSGHPRRTFVLLDLVVPALLRLAQMLGQLGLVAWLNGGSGNTVWSRFSVWDGQLYAAIAQHGYPHSIVISNGSLTAGQQFAFSPVYPGATWLLHTVLRLGVIPAQLVVSWAASIAFGVLVHLIVRDTGHSRRAGYVATWLIGALPMAVVLQMGYAEALCAALEAGAIYAAVRRRWWLAAVLSFVAGATRPTGGLVGLAVGCLALRSRWRRDADSEPQPDYLRITVATVSGILGMMAWLYFVWIRTGHPRGWFQVEKAGWGTHFDMGKQGFTFLHDTLRMPDDPGWTAVIATLIVLLTMTAVLTVVLGGLDTLPYSVIGVLTLAITLGSTNYWHSRPRLLLGAALLVVPLGTMVGRARLRTVAPILLFAFLASAWFGAWMVDGWPYAI